MKNKIIQGNCLEVLKTMPDNSIDSICTDPPYGIGFMGKEWDSTGIAYNVDLWKECLRVLKPGGHLLSFGGTRTYHRMACAIEDAGFEIRDCIMWLYGSGFPKSLNIGKAVDKLQGNERKIVREEKEPLRQGGNVNWDMRSSSRELSKGSSEWEGWGTALKPAHEPIVWATKSLTFNKDFAILEDINNNLISTIWQSLENIQNQDISKLQETVLIHLNTVLLWKNILEESLKNESKFTTSTVSKMITELKILNSLLLKNTQDDTGGKSQTYQNGTQEFQVSGLDLLVKIVESCLEGEKKNISDIQKLIVQGLAIYKQNRTGMNVRSVEQDLLPIILNANSVLINVLTDIITELKLSELNTFVSFVEKSLKQYLAEPQSIADENVWQEHIQKALPNHSPICMARKPLSEKSVAENVLKWGTGGINIDECRIGTKGEKLDVGGRGRHDRGEGYGFKPMGDFKIPEGQGRFPANVILDKEAGKMLDEQSGNSKSGKYKGEGGKSGGIWKKSTGVPAGKEYGDKGGASRFFYCAKASKSERNMGCDGLEIKENLQGLDNRGRTLEREDGTKTLVDRFSKTPSQNNHPTVKPIKLMQYLCRLITPKGGTVLDPFCGSGSTCCACVLEGFNYIGIDLEKDYCKIARARVKAFEEKKRQKTLL